MRPGSRTTRRRERDEPEPSRRRFVAAALATAFAGLGGGSLSPPATSARRGLRVVGRHFVDGRGRVVILRGINLAGDSKVPPFLPIDTPRDLDRLPPLGFNALRLVFIWEAFEPARGVYDFAYLARMREAAGQAWARGLHVIVDFHQDGFARNLSKGSGDGFPLWAASPEAVLSTPDNGPDDKDWPLRMATDPGTRRSWREFYADTHGVRSRFLAMLRTVARGFAGVPGVIGYDLLNEPCGDEATQLAPLYEDAARAIRGEDPTAILFVEGHVVTNAGLQTRLTRPTFDNFAYAPHYYSPLTLRTNNWRGAKLPIEHAFTKMTAKAAEWGVPLFLSEFGGPAEAKRISAYVETLYEHLDASMLSGTQWNYTPHWDPVKKDGWNGEDFMILDPAGKPRPNFRPRPFPRVLAGEPIRFGWLDGCPTEGRSLFEAAWDHRPECGETEVFLPGDLFPPGSVVTTTPGEATVWRDEARQLLFVTSPKAGAITLRVVSP